MTPLYPAMTAPAATDRHPKLVHDGALDGQIFLILRHDAAPDDRAPAVGARAGQRRVMRQVAVRRPRPMRATAVGPAWLAAGPRGMLFRQPPREGRGLAGRPSTRHLELFFQPLVFAPQTVALDLRAPHVLAQPLVFTPQLLDDVLGITRRQRIFRAPRHGIVMPDSRGQYKRECGSAER